MRPAKKTLTKLANTSNRKVNPNTSTAFTQARRQISFSGALNTGNTFRPSTALPQTEGRCRFNSVTTATNSPILNPRMAAFTKGGKNTLSSTSSSATAATTTTQYPTRCILDRDDKRPAV